MSDPKLEELTELFHVLFCNKRHAREMEELQNRQPDVCYYKLESVLDSCWNCESHKKMMIYTLTLCDDLGFDSADVALAFFSRTLELCQQLNELISEHPRSSEIVRGLIG
jgi:hypothetical protein